jgi:hypothetical protein
MTTRPIAISLVLLSSSACVVIAESDDDIGDESSETDSSGDSTSTGTESDSETETETDDETETDSDSSESESTDGLPPDDCEGVGESNLPGVCIWFPTPADTWTLDEVAQGIAIPYHVIVEADVAEVVTSPQDAGGCGMPDASGLIVFGRIVGGDQQYCVCDTGICPAPSDVPVTIPAGDTPFEFEWNGVNWGGPSDTNNPFGPPFPPDDYALLLSATGTVGDMSFEVSNTFSITLTE